MDSLRRRLFFAVALLGATGCSGGTATAKKSTRQPAKKRSAKTRSPVPKNRSRGPQSLAGLMSMDEYVADLDHASADRRIEAVKRLGAIGPSAKSALQKLEKLAADDDAKMAAAAQAAIKQISR